MSKRANKKTRSHVPSKPQLRTIQSTDEQIQKSIFDKIEAGNEYASLVKLKKYEVDLSTEFRAGLKALSTIRNKYTICYMANTINQKVSHLTNIDITDDLPFSELVDAIPREIKEIDIILVTNGGSGPQVAKFVDKLRPRFDKVNFILPNVAMSAGTIFIMSGNSILMDSRSYFGPIDPQVPSINGQLVPAQSLLRLMKEIQENGEKKLKRREKP